MKQLWKCQVLAIAKNSEGEAQAATTLDVYLWKDFRQLELQPTKFRTGAERELMEQSWQEVSSLLFIQALSPDDTNKLEFGFHRSSSKCRNYFKGNDGIVG